MVLIKRFKNRNKNCKIKRLQENKMISAKMTIISEKMTIISAKMIIIFEKRQ